MHLCIYMHICIYAFILSTAVYKAGDPRDGDMHIYYIYKHICIYTYMHICIHTK